MKPCPRCGTSERYQTRTQTRCRKCTLDAGKRYRNSTTVPKLWANVTADEQRAVRRAAEIRGVTVAEFVRTEVLPAAEDEIKGYCQTGASK